MTVYSFGGYRLDTDRMEVIGPDGPLRAEPRVLDVLRYLVEHRDRLVTREDLLDQVWGDRFVSVSALATQIKQARRLIGDDGDAQAAIRTVHGRGYRFVADVRTEPSGADAEPATPATPPTPPTPATPPTPLPPLPAELDLERSQPFVGREREIGRALAVLEQDEAGARAGWVAVSGEPGIGKTRLAARVAHEARARGARVLFGRCSEELAVPYQPVVEVLRAATTGLVGEPLCAVLGPLPGELTRLLPDLRERAAGVAAPFDADPETERHLLFEAVGGCLAALAADRRLVIVIDDAQWATESTVQLLEHLARGVLAAPICLVLTVRDTEEPRSPRLRELLDLLETHRHHELLHLGGLDDAAARLLLGGVDDVPTVVRRTAGNPLLMQALAESRDHQGGVEAAVRRRLAGLGPEARDTLAVASVAGEEFDLKVVARAQGREEAEVIRDLDRAGGARLLVDLGSDAYRFAHALVRTSLIEGVGAARRARWHEAIGAALVEVHEGRLEPVAHEVAHHYALASVGNPALRRTAAGHLRNAARQASEQLSFGEAADLLQRARGLVEDLDPEMHAQLALEQGEAETRDGRSVPALRSFDAAFSWAAQAGRPDRIAEAALRYEDASWRPGHSGGPSIERLRFAVDRSQPGDTETRARLMIALTRAYGMTGDGARSDEAFAEAERLVAAIGSPLLEARALTARYATAVDDRAEPPMASIERLRELSDLVEDIEVRLLARQIHLRALARLALMDEYRAALAETRAMVAGLRSSFWDYVIGQHSTLLALHDGDLAAAEREARRCAEIGGQLEGEDTSGSFGLQMFVIRREQNLLAPLAPTIRQLLSGEGADTFWAPGLALLLNEIGHRDEAAAMLQTFRTQGFELPGDAMSSTVLTLLIELAVSLDEPESARLLYDRFAHHARRAIVTGHGIVSFGSADRHLGMLATVLGDLATAEDHLTRAVEVNDRNGAVLWAAHSRARLADVRARQGRHAEAGELRDLVGLTARERGYAALAASVADHPGAQ